MGVREEAGVAEATLAPGNASFRSGRAWWWWPSMLGSRAEAEPWCRPVTAVLPIGDGAETKPAFGRDKLAEDRMGFCRREELGMVFKVDTSVGIWITERERCTGTPHLCVCAEVLAEQELGGDITRSLPAALVMDDM